MLFWPFCSGARINRDSSASGGLSADERGVDRKNHFLVFKQIMIKQFIAWYFFEIPKKIIKIWRNYLWFFYKYFALADLCRDFFAPWKGMVFHREKRAFEIGDALSAWFGNVFVSRPIGAVARLFFIAIGLVAEGLVLVAGVLAFIGWIVYVPAIFYFLAAGSRLIM